MTAAEAPTLRRERTWPDVALVGAGMTLLALAAHQDGWLRLVAVGGLVAASLGVARAVYRSDAPGRMMGLAPLGRRALAWLPAGVAVGVATAMLYRWHLGEAVLPAALGRFAWVAVAIGAAEELLYRGFVQGRARWFGPAGAVLVAAALHTLYKTALFAAPPAGIEVDPAFLAFWTLAGGIVFGAMREAAASAWPPVLAHAAFDLAVYGPLATAPWWVW